jgi:hypothetical protein
MVALLCALPMFAQCFQYMTDLPPLYMLSKAWPALMIPLVVWGLIALDVPYKPLHIITLLWILGVTPIVGMLQLGNGFGAALATTVKVWSYSFVFSAAALLVLLHPTPAALRRLLIVLGLATYGVMTLLWVTVPAAAYVGSAAVTKLFMYDTDRGFRIYMPMFFAMLLVFTLNRSFWIRPAFWKIAGIAVAIVLILGIYKERVAITAALVTIALGGAMSMGRWRKAVFAAMALAAGILLVVLAHRFHTQPALHDSLGTSLSVRQVSFSMAWKYLSAEPLRWMLGVGATTRFGDVSLSRLFGNTQFFLSDIGWLGIVFEYGAVGALLLLFVHLAGLRITYRCARADDALTLALADYILYLIIVSAIYSEVYTPGELTTAMALSYYLAGVSGYGASASHPASSSPRHRAVASVRPSGLSALPTPSGRLSRG